MIPPQIKAVIFDVDGLIIDSEPTWKKTHADFFARHNLLVDEQYIATLRGIGLKELVEKLQQKFQIDKSIDELLAEYREIFYKNFFSTGASDLLTGVEDCVKKLHEKGYLLAVATGGHTKEKMEKILISFNLLKYFPVVVSSDEVARGKPNPDVFLVTAQKLQVPFAECLVLEDSVNGVQAGKAARMLVFGINSDEKVYNDLKENGADQVFHTLSEVKI